ncbi:hypothetical protein C900_04817 [Fulvivirga imtechensis AK7]|uniref:Uncharacterized protein n=1 Tax=Fulvivirga imtechensis AK7 TaxID=1237149 RepID=L8JQE0_9BACT|nr:hypothetical protein [Fulvivirga imtechensis]ELR69592.1 hypothetical protein C900_04817 [Fulvivirga imtechensis AK7]
MKWVNRRTLTVIIGVIVAIIIIITSTSMTHPVTPAPGPNSSSVDMDEVHDLRARKIDNLLLPLPKLVDVLYQQIKK